MFCTPSRAPVPRHKPFKSRGLGRDESGPFGGLIIPWFSVRIRADPVNTLVNTSLVRPPRRPSSSSLRTPQGLQSDQHRRLAPRCRGPYSPEISDSEPVAGRSGPVRRSTRNSVASGTGSTLRGCCANTTGGRSPNRTTAARGYEVRAAGRPLGRLRSHNLGHHVSQPAHGIAVRTVLNECNDIEGVVPSSQSDWWVCGRPICGGATQSRPPHGGMGFACRRLHLSDGSYRL